MNKALLISSKNNILTNGKQQATKTVSEPIRKYRYMDTKKVREEMKLTSLIQKYSIPEAKDPQTNNETLKSSVLEVLRKDVYDYFLFNFKVENSLNHLDRNTHELFMRAIHGDDVYSQRPQLNVRI